MLRNPNQPRVPLAEPAAVPEQLGPPISLFRAFAVRPDRALGIHGWGRYYLSRQCALSLRHRELVINRTTALCGAEYEWGIHLATFAVKAGITEDQIRSLTSGTATDTCWTDPADQAVFRAVDALHTRNDLTDDEWAPLVEAVGPDGAIDLMLICGWYHAVSYVARAARLSPEPGSPTFDQFRRVI